MSNPLLDYTGLPPFSKIQAEHVLPAVEQILTENRAELERLLESNAEPSWAGLLEPLEEMEDRLARAWSPVRHLNSVRSSPEIREAHTSCLPLLSAYYTDLGQSEPLYRAYQAIRDGAEWERLDSAQKKVIEDALRGFRLSGVALDDEKKARYKKINQRLSEIYSQYEQNLLQATDAWSRLISDPAELAGLPESIRDQARQAAMERRASKGESSEREAGEEWLFTLQAPSYIGLITYSDRRELREEIYTAYTTRASELGPHAGRWDNSDLMKEILALRYELAQLLGFASYRALSLETKMAESPEHVIAFLEDLVARARPVAQRELDELRAFARDLDGLQELQSWDLAYYSEKLKQARYSVSEEELKQYFPAERVVSGMFEVVGRLFGLRIEQAEEEVDTWHPSVRFYRIFDAENRFRGAFYLDLYAREQKRGGAWMDELVGRRRYAGEIQHPIAYLTCNAAPPIAERPALLTHDDVITLFHEFGHGLHHMLTQVDYSAVAGISGVEWDAVELPSQLMENWCWEEEALEHLTAHWESRESLPRELLDRLRAAKNFQAGMQMVRQLEFALFDMALHGEVVVEDIALLLAQVRDQVAVIQPPPFNRFQNSFSHIFAGGYAAGYYSYKWAEVLSADAFARFEENHIFSAEVGRELLQSVLERGGSRPAKELFMQFRKREPSIEALLRHNGLALEEAA